MPLTTKTATGWTSLLIPYTFLAAMIENRGGSGMSRAIFALLMVGMLGCAHKEEKKVEAPTQPPPAAPAPAPQAAAPKSDSMCATDLDCGAAQLCLNQ